MPEASTWRKPSAQARSNFDASPPLLGSLTIAAVSKVPAEMYRLLPKDTIGPKLSGTVAICWGTLFVVNIR